MAINTGQPQSKTVSELRSLNQNEMDILIDSLHLAASDGHKRLARRAEILLENDAEFIRGLFWTSRR